MVMANTSLSLLERAASGSDSLAWQQLCDIYTPLLLLWLNRFDVPADETDDLIQEVLLFAANRLASFEHNGRPGAFRSWLRAVLAHRVQKFWRRSGRHRRSAADYAQELSQLEDPGSALSRIWDREHAQHVAHQILEQIRPSLEEQTWDAFSLTVLQGQPPREVATRLGMSPNAVCAAKCRVLKKVRQIARGILD